jgi:uncharacterized protein YndB with AHSA1/START domain
MAIHVESEIEVARSPGEVFDYLAHAERLPDYVADFASVEQASPGEPGPGTQYRYRMNRGGVEGTFEWTEFQPTSRLAWHGPPVKSGPGSMEPAGWWELADAGGGTRVKLVMAPKPGGLFKLMAPFMAMGMRKGNERALARLKANVEGAAPTPG